MKQRRQPINGKGDPSEEAPRPKRRTNFGGFMKGKRQYQLASAMLILVLVFYLLAFRTVVLSEYNDSSSKIPLTFQVRSRQRFPPYGTREFAQLCPWTQHNRPLLLSNCTFWVRPSQKSEGIAEWLSMAAMAHILALETGCQIHMDYGDDVHVHHVLRPLSMNWTSPHGFECSNQCVNITPFTATQLALGSVEVVAKAIGTTNKVGRVPYYRFAYVDSPYLYKDIYQSLQQELSGFDLGMGMACSLGSLLDLAPTASQFMPDLFTRILPALQDKNSLVMAICIRSGHTDRAAKAEKRNGSVTVKEETDRYQELAVPCLQCVFQLEQQSLSSGVDFSRIVWMLVTDSAYIKQWIRESYAGSQTVSSPTRNSKPIIIREIITTTSRGIHTRSERNPSTADFAEALIDWYLIGESDVVVTNDHHHTFGATASLRTARPFYNGKNCTELPRFGPPKFQTALEMEQEEKERKRRQRLKAVERRDAQWKKACMQNPIACGL